MVGHALLPKRHYSLSREMAPLRASFAWQTSSVWASRPPEFRSSPMKYAEFCQPGVMETRAWRCGRQISVVARAGCTADH